MEFLSKEFAFFFKDYIRDVNRLFTDFKSPSHKINAYMLQDMSLNLKEFKGARFSHIIRDPRDMVVSGYYYHLKCDEPWCTVIEPSSFQWLVNKPIFKEFFPHETSFPDKISYQQYLNQLTEEEGITLEMIWRTSHFESMIQWDYNNPDCIEMRYEDIIGNEEESFRSIFTHYGLSDQIVTRGVELAKTWSLQNRKKEKDKHVRNGKPNQWPSVLTPRLLERFKEIHPQVLEKTGYNS